MLIESPFRALRERKDQYLNEGFDYRGQILKRTTAGPISKMGGFFGEFRDRIEEHVYEMVESIKLIKTFANDALDKNHRKGIR
jgi:hypothetical protein